MTIPTYDEMFYECLSLFNDKQQHHVKYVRQQLAHVFSLSEEECHQLLQSGTQPQFDNRCGWCLSYLFHANLLIRTSKGTYQISSEGFRILQNYNNNNDLKILINNLMNKNNFQNHLHNDDESYSQAYYNNNSPKNSSNELDNTNTPDEQIDVLYKIITDKLAEDLLNKILEQTPTFFERMVVKLLEHMGYGGYDSTVTQTSKDGGIDGIINEDKLGFGKIYIQAKRWDINQTIGRPEIQKFAGALHENNASKGLFITTARFSNDAKDSAKKNNIILVDGDKLASLMIDYDFGVSTERVYKIKRIDSDFFINNDDE